MGGWLGGGWLRIKLIIRLSQPQAGDWLAGLAKSFFFRGNRLQRISSTVDENENEECVTVHIDVM